MSPRPKIIATGVILALLVGGGAWYWSSLPAAGYPAIAGIVRTTEVRIAPQVSGRLVRFLVAPGQKVQAGDPVALLNNPELWAALALARAEVDKARSERDRIYAGVRDEQVRALQSEIAKATASHTEAVDDLSRKSALAARAVASQSDLDTAQAAEARTRAEIAVAQARYAEAALGPTPEERRLADAAVVAAEAARDVVEARAAKMLLRTAAAGTIATLVAEPGEALVPGAPVLTMVPAGGMWFGFNMREDTLAGLHVGSTVSVRLAAGGNPVSSRVAELRNWGEFAVWKAARATGDHDLNTFFLRLDPVQPVTGISPGQTVWLVPMEGKGG